MNVPPLGPVLLQLAQALVSGEIQPKVRRTIAHTIYMAIIVALGVVFGITAIGCGLAALWLSVQIYLGPVGGFLIVAAVLAVMSVAMALVLRLDDASPAPPPRQAQATRECLTDASRLLSDNKGTALMAALLVGLSEGTRKK